MADKEPAENEMPLPADRELPHPERCDPARPDYAEIIARHTDALVAGRNTYIDPETGYQVWTARYLWQRGFCCDTWCRHCPWIER